MNHNIPLSFLPLLFLSIVTLSPISSTQAESFNEASISSLKAKIDNIPGIENIKIDPLLDLISLYEADEEMLARSFGFKNWKIILINDPDNKADHNHLGAVKLPFKIGQNMVTAQQYAIFLNIVAVADDKHQLFDSRMETDPCVACIKRTVDAQGMFHYTTLPGREDVAMSYVSWESAARFCNWLHNGFPEKTEGEKTTETGGYTFHDDGTITLNPEALYFIPTEDQWYKAAYYQHDLYFSKNDGMTDYDSAISVEKGDFSYYIDYPTSNIGDEPGKSSGIGNANYANDPEYTIFNLPGEVNYYNGPFNGAANVNNDLFCLKPVGSFGAGHHGLCDMGGELNEWTSTLLDPNQKESYIIRGGSWRSPVSDLHRDTKRVALSRRERNNTTGFRVAAVATPLTAVAPPQTIEEAMIADLQRHNGQNLKDLTTTALLQPLLGPVEFLGCFLLHEGFEAVGIFTADAVVNSCFKTTSEEGVAQTPSTLWRYWRVMAIPTGVDLASGIYAGGTWGNLNAAEVIVHAAIDSIACRMIDSYGMDEAVRIATSWGLQPLIDFYKGAHHISEWMLSGFTNRLNAYGRSRGWTQGESICLTHPEGHDTSTEVPISKKVTSTHQAFSNVSCEDHKCKHDPASTWSKAFQKNFPKSNS